MIDDREYDIMQLAMLLEEDPNNEILFEKYCSLKHEVYGECPIRSDPDVGLAKSFYFVSGSPIGQDLDEIYSEISRFLTFLHFVWGAETIHPDIGESVYNYIHNVNKTLNLTIGERFPDEDYVISQLEADELVEKIQVAKTQILDSRQKVCLPYHWQTIVVDSYTFLLKLLESFENNLSPYRMEDPLDNEDLIYCFENLQKSTKEFLNNI